MRLQLARLIATPLAMLFLAGLLATAAISVRPSPARAASLPAVTAGLPGPAGDFPAGDPGARGWAFMTLDSVGGQICYDYQIDNIDTTTAADVRAQADPSTVIAALALPDSSGDASGCVAVAGAVVDDIATNPSAYFLAIHTVAFPAYAAAGHFEAAPTGTCLLTEDVSTPIPGSPKHLAVGSTLHLLGVGFPPNTGIQLDFTRGAQPAGSETLTTDANGDLVAYTSFSAAEAGFWTIDAVGPGGSCESFVQVGVNTAFDGVITFLCPPSIQSAADLKSVGSSVCKLALRAADAPPLPAGFTSNTVAATWDDAVVGIDALPWHLPSDGELNGGGLCNPSTKVCTFGYSYRLEWVPLGDTTVTQDSAPAGYRFGAATAFLRAGGAPIDLSAGPGNVLSIDSEMVSTVAIYDFFGATAPTPTPAPSSSPTPAATTLPNTAAIPSPADRGDDSWALIVGFVMLFIGSLVGLCTVHNQSVRRRSPFV
jgi:hypothetical protein